VGPRGGILEGGAIVKVILETTRLFLRELSLADLDFAAEMRADPEVMRYYPRYYSRDETEAWVRKQIDLYHTQNHALWLAVDRDTLRPVGHVGLVRQLVDGVEEREVGYMIHRTFWRRGFATEAAIGTRDHAFDTLGLERVISLIHPDNVPSQGVARKLGMAPERRTLFNGFEHLLYSVSSSRGGHGSGT